MKRRIAEILAVVLTAALGVGCQPSAGDLGDLPQETDLGRPISGAEFMREGYELRRRIIPSGALTVPQNEQLAVVWQGALGRHLDLTVQSLRDLSEGDLFGGYVDVDTQAKALSYVRLTTSSAYCGLLREWQGWEILPGGRCGDDGKIGQSALTEAGWEPPRIERRGETWVIVRYIAGISKTGELHPDRIVRVTEEVTQGGVYKVVSEAVTYTGRLDGITIPLKL